MPTIQESINRINTERIQAEEDLKKNKDKAHETEVLLEFFAKSFSELVRQMAHIKYGVEVTNLPKDQRINGKVEVDGLSALLYAIDQLNLTTKKNKLDLPEVQSVKGEVKITNPTPEVKIPDYPKQIKTDVATLPKYVGEKLDKITEQVKKIELSPKITVQKDTPRVEIDLQGIEKRLEAISGRLNLLEFNPVVEVDVNSVRDAVDEVRKSINNLKFPVPSFKSSWSHSLSMRSEDLDKTYTWTSDGGKDVVETITVKDEDGSSWRRTYTYDGSGKVLTESKWTRV